MKNSKSLYQKTAKIYTAKVRTEYYGKVYMKEEGTKGSCKYAYVVSNQWDEAILLTEEQNKQISRLIHSIYTNEQEPLMYEAFKEGQITEEEYLDFLDNWQKGSEARYLDFTTQLEQLLGFYPTKVTKITDKESSAF